MITLYYCRTSYASHKVLLYFAEKKLSYNPHHIDLRKQEHITSDYRQINPNGTVPSMIDDDGTIVINSTDIMERLEREHPSPALLPKDSALCLKIHELCKAHEALHDPYIRTLSYANIFMSGNKRDTLDEKRIIELAHHHPNKKRGEFLERAIQGKLTNEEINSAKQAVRDGLDHMESLLSQYHSGFMIGDAYSIADCVCTATAYRICAIGMEADLNNYPQAAKWYQAMQQRPSFSTILQQ